MWSPAPSSGKPSLHTGLSPGTEEDSCSQLLHTSPVQWPAYRPWPAKVEREITKGRVPRTFTRALGGAEGQRAVQSGVTATRVPGCVAGGRAGRKEGGRATANPCWAGSCASAPDDPRAHRVTGDKPVSPDPPSSEALGMAWGDGAWATSYPLRAWAPSPSCPGPIPAPRSPPPAWAPTCGRPRLPSGRTGCVGCSAWRETGGWRHRRWLPAGSRQAPLEERGLILCSLFPADWCPHVPGAPLAALCRPQTHARDPFPVSLSICQSPKHPPSKVWPQLHASPT